MAQLKNLEILPEGSHNVILKLATVGSIDLKTQASTNLFTVPTGKTLFVTDIIIRITTADTFSTPVSMEVGKTAGFDEWMAATELTGLDTAEEFISLASLANGSIRQTFAAAEVLALNITTGAGATTLTGEATVFGFLI